MTDVGSPAPRDTRGPTRTALLVLVLATVALVATGAPIPTLESTALGEVTLGPGETVERDLHISLARPAGAPTRGRVDLTLQASSGLDAAYGSGASIRFVAASDASGPFAPPSVFPAERCAAGCELDFRIAVDASPQTLPGSVVRYQVKVHVEFDSSGSLEPNQLLVALEGPASGPVAPAWSVLAGLVALVAGIAVGPSVTRLLPADRRRWLALALAATPIALAAWTGIETLAWILSFDGLQDLGPLAILYLVDPWTVILMAVLAWGLVRGVRVWPDDGGWSLGLAAAATAGLAGLWLAWSTTRHVAIQPVALALLFMAFGGLAGVVIGQAWRSDARAFHDRVPGALAVVSHGIVIAGFGFLAQRTLYDPFGDASALLLLVPAALVALAFRRWLTGRRGWLVLFDVLIAAIGALGTVLWASVPFGLSADAARLEIDDVAVGIALTAAIVGLLTSFHRMPSGPREPTGALADIPATT